MMWKTYGTSCAKLPPIGYFQAHVTIKFWEITDNIWETVQDRDIVATDD